MQEESADTVMFLQVATGGVLTTVCVIDPLLKPELSSPPYCAVIECDPMDRELVLNVA